MNRIEIPNAEGIPFEGISDRARPPVTENLT